MGGEGKKESIHAISNHGIITATMTSKVYDEREKKFEKKRERERIILKRRNVTIDQHLDKFNKKNAASKFEIKRFLQNSIKLLPRSIGLYSVITIHFIDN